MTAFSSYDFTGEGAHEFDDCYLGGKLLPGLARLSGPGLKRDLDKKKPKGASKASLKDEGDELGGIDIELEQTTNAEFNEFVTEVLPLISPRRPGGPKSPISIVHPAANVLDINNIYVEQIPVFDHDKSGPKIIWTIKSVEWVPAPVPQKKGAGSKGANKKDDVQNDTGGADPEVDWLLDATPEELEAFDEFNQKVKEGEQQANDLLDFFSSPENTQDNAF